MIKVVEIKIKRTFPAASTGLYMYAAKAARVPHG
jgi:hypothetical protein